MGDLFVTKIHVNKVRHLHDFDVVLSDDVRKHLILTGKNGSGKTSLLESMKDEILWKQQMSYHKFRDAHIGNDYLRGNSGSESKYEVALSFSDTTDEKVNYLAAFFAYIGAHRGEHSIPKAIEQLEMRGKTVITRNASKDFLRYILSLDYQLYGAKTDGNAELEANIKKWFDGFNEALREIYDSPDTKLQRDTKNLSFLVDVPGREPFPLQNMSDGYKAFLDIYMELLMRFENGDAIVEYDTPAIVLIDEIETHLHVELQKRILPFLTKMFPRVQFIVATHSPFVIISLPNAVVYDLEKKEQLDNRNCPKLRGI